MGLHAGQNTLLFEIPSSRSEVIEARSRYSEAKLLVQISLVKAWRSVEQAGLA